MSSSRDTDGTSRRGFLRGAAAGAVGLGLVGALGQQSASGDEPQAPAATGMKTRVLGKTGLETSVICYGGGALRPETTSLAQAARNHGINFFDVAQNYGRGQAELGMGRFLAEIKDRESIIISSKLSGFGSPSGSSKAVYQAFMDRIKTSLDRMGTDYVDIMMWPHGAADPKDFRNPAAQEAMRKIKEQGIVRHWGTSTHTNYVKTSLAAIEDGFYEVILVVLNICTQNAKIAGQPEQQTGGGRQRPRGVEDTTSLMKAAQEKNVGVMAMKVANPGYLTTATNDLVFANFPDESTLTGYQKLYTYGVRQAGVGSVLVGIRSAQHLREAVEVGKS